MVISVDFQKFCIEQMLIFLKKCRLAPLKTKSYQKYDLLLQKCV